MYIGVFGEYVYILSAYLDSVSEPKRLFPDPAPDPTFQIIPDPAPDPFPDPGQNQIF